ncbi:hypothetical protein [Pseudanabaena sp. FACHB-2040]|uniref:hypothetical protein n=1 Tax=Pseudanabaena sp. FACHB-2040 TaxID=2692859 RepID=UPI0016898491|nr:hypothetical protein [Pseudanabaena sp. FACHB-2040]MBD2259810.1 hypothetical protein [Pseudanabaena sp. FACHB-2040]
MKQDRFEPSIEAHSELRLNQPRGEAGRFASMYQEKRGDAIALRLPVSLDQALRQAVGWQSKADNATLKAWIEDAIAAKLKEEGEG